MRYYNSAAWSLHCEKREIFSNESWFWIEENILNSELNNFSFSSIADVFPQHKDLGGAVSRLDTHYHSVAPQSQSVKTQQFFRFRVQGHLQQDHVLPTGSHMWGLLSVVPRGEYTSTMQVSSPTNFRKVILALHPNPFIELRKRERETSLFPISFPPQFPKDTQQRPQPHQQGPHQLESSSRWTVANYCAK